MDYSNDPELKALREEFIASFSERRSLLAEALRAVPADATPCDRDALEKVQFVAHKVAGIAASYGFAELGEVAGEIDDALDAPGRVWSGEEIHRVSSLLDRKLAEAAG